MGVKRGIYRHYKGNYYEVLEVVGTCTETLEKVVVYKDNEDRVWVRPLEMFISKVEHKGLSVDRFTYVYKL